MQRKMMHLILLFLAVFLIPFSVNAAQNVTLKIDKDNLEIGDEVTISANISSNIEAYALQATLKYDENVFEQIDDESFSINSTMDISYNENSNKFGIINQTGKITNELFKVRLKVKENANVGNTNIALTNMSYSDGESIKDLDKVSTKVLVTKDAVEGEAISINKENKITEDQENTIKVFSTKPIIILISVIIVLLLIGIVYMSINYRDKKKPLYCLIAIGIILLITDISLFITNTTKKDVNSDGKKDYDDSKEIIDYLISIDTKNSKDSDKDLNTKKATNKITRKYDINNDGRFNIRDAAGSVEDINNKTNVKLKEVKAENEYYVEKGNIDLKFTAEINPKEVKITKVKVDNKYYDVKSNSGVYIVLVDDYTKAGPHDFVINEVKLSNGEVRNTNLKIKKEILKDKPKVKNLSYDIKEGNLKFSIDDNDTALQNAELTIFEGIVSENDLRKSEENTGIIDEEGNEINSDDFDDYKIVLEKELKHTDKSFSIKPNLSLGGVYTIVITGEYDLDVNKDNDKNDYQEQFLNDGLDNITVGKIVIAPLEQEEIFLEQKNTYDYLFDVTFEPQSISQEIKQVKIGEIYKDITYEDGHCKLSLDDTSTAGLKTEDITAIVLNDGTEVLSKHEVKYDVLKAIPTISNFIYNKKKNKISFTLSDKDNAFRDVNIKITNKDNGTEVFKENLFLDKKEFEFQVKLDEGNKYDVNIDGSYDRDSDINNNKNNSKTKFNHGLTVYNVALSNVEKEKYHVEKNSEFELKFNANITPVNENATIKEVTIEDQVYNPTKESDGTYSIKLNSPNESGEKTYKLENIIIDDEEIDETLNVNVDVLKDKPKVENLLIDESKSIPEIYFDLVDEDNALDNESKPGKLTVAKTGGTSKDFDIKKGTNKIKLEDFTDEFKDEGGIFDLDIKADYNLDPDKKVNKYHETNKELIDKKQFKIYTATLTPGSYSEYVPKDKEIEFQINSAIQPYEPEVTIKSFVLKDNKVVSAKQLESLTKYSVNLKTPTVAGPETYQIEKIILSNDIEINTKCNDIKVDVLKDKPYVNKLNLSENNDSISYKLEDPDHALSSGKITIYNNNGDSIKEENVEKDSKSSIKYDFKDAETYIVKVVGSYDLDSTPNNNKNEASNEEMQEESFIIGGAYNFTLTDASITDALQPGEKPVITFKSTNTRNAIINKANLKLDGGNSKQYDVIETSKNNYKITLDDANVSVGKHTITLDSVSMTNDLKTFENKKDYNTNQLTYTVLKKEPKASDFNLNLNKTNKTVTAKFKLNDEDNTISKLNLVLVDSTGKIIASQILSKENIASNKEISVNLSYKGNTDGRLTFKVLADYELADKYTYTNESIGEDTTLVYSNDEIRIDKMYVVNDKNEEQKEGLYPIKNQNNYQIAVEVYVADSVKARGYGRVSGVTINGVNYPANQISGYKSKVYINIPKESGILELKANRVQLANDGYYKVYNDYYSVEEKTLKLDVLKDKPKIENLEINEDYEKGQVTFDFNVVLDDNASKDEFTNGTLTLNGVTKNNITEGKNSVTFENVKKDETFDLIFKGNYDLDTDSLNSTTGEKNNVVNGEFYKVSYGLYDADTYSDIKIDKCELISEKGNKYFEKNENIKLKFSISGIEEKLKVSPSKVVIKDKEYPINQLDDGSYELILDGYSSSGEKSITITDIVLSNNKKVKLIDGYIFNPEVLKDIPEITDYTYDISDNKLNLKFDLKDSDDAIVNKAIINVLDENGKELYNGKFTKQLSIDIKDKNILRYYVKVYGEYDRDIDKGKNTDNHKEVVLLDELISQEKNNIEFKDITDINLYKKEKQNNEDVITLKDIVDVTDIKNNKNDYFVEVIMENMPDAYAKIKSVSDSDNKLVLELDYEYVTKENSKNNKSIKIDFGQIKDNKASNDFHPGDAFKLLLEKLEAGEDVELNQNYDASSFTTSNETYIVNEYKGKLNGNGYSIKHLTKPLFNTINGGTVENLRLSDVTFGSNGKGALANSTKKSTLKDVLVENVTKTAGGNGTNGGLVGGADSTTIENCRAINVLLNLDWLEQNNGTFIGTTSNGTTVKNCYAKGTISGGWNFTSGFIGNAKNSTITNSYVHVTMKNLTNSKEEGFADRYNEGISTFKNNVCISTGSNGSFAKSSETRENNYFYQTDGGAQDIEDKVKAIKEEDINDELFTTKAKFDSNWNIKDVSINNLPTLQKENKSVLNNTELDDYNKENELLYSNLVKLMPFYDSNKIIEVSKNIKDDNLKTKKIKHILPIDINGSLVTYLTSDNPKNITKLKIVYSDNTKEEYNVLYDKTYDMVATYKINDLGIDYNYNHYVIDSSSQVVTNLTNYLNNLDYTNNLDSLTTNDDSRLYRDFYNETTKNELKEFVLKYLSNSEYTNTENDEIINNYIEREVKKDKKIEKVLYVYNYFRRFYDLDIDGLKVYDYIMFNMKDFDELLTPDKVANLYLENTKGENFNTNETSRRYNEILGKYTNLDTVPKFIGYLVSNFSNHDLSEWTRSQFKGIIKEIPLEENKNVKYTLWDHFATETNNEILNQFLPMLTLPENAAYIISMPVQYIIGAQRTYISNPDDPKQHQELLDRMETYTTRMARYFKTSYSILRDQDLFNNILIYHIDKRTTKNENGTSVHNTVYTTTEPFHKNFVEATGLWAAAAGVNAAAWGPRLEWQVAGVMDSQLAVEGKNDTSHVTFRTWSHESAHLIDARLFLRNNGRRFDAGGEDYADNFLMQSFGKNDITMNLSMLMHDDKEQVASNLNPERINSPEKIHDFYRKLFETVYVMDYIEAQAFLKLPEDVQKNLAIQVSYPNEDKQFERVVGPDGKDTDQFTGALYKNDQYAKYRARETTKYTRLNEIENFNTPLKTMDDLINNRIMLYPGVYRYSSRGNNSYGGEGINTVHWYQPNNPDGRPDSYALKWISYEMLGYKGYDNGFVEYASNIHNTPKQIYSNLSHPKNGLTTVNFKSDSMALQQISNNAYSSFSEYKKSRFNDIKSKLERLDSDINVDNYIDKFVDSLTKDATDITENIDKILEKSPSCPSDYWCSRGDFAKYLSYQYSTALRQEIYYKLKNKTNDFTDEIFKDTKQQTISKLAK